MTFLPPPDHTGPETTSVRTSPSAPLRAGPPGTFASPHAAAHLAGVPETRVYSLVLSGSVRTDRLSGGRLLVCVEDVEREVAS